MNINNFQNILGKLQANVDSRFGLKVWTSRLRAYDII